MSFFLSWTPILLILVLAVVFRVKALYLGIWGCLFSAFLAIFVFKTGAGVVLTAAADGVATSSPLLLVVFVGVILSSVLLETGSLGRLSQQLVPQKGGAAVGTGIICFGIGNFMEGAGVINEPVVAPIARAAGNSPDMAAYMSIAGYAGLMHLSLAGVIVAVLSTVTGLPAGTLTTPLGLLSIPATVLLALSLPFADRDSRKAVSFERGGVGSGIGILVLAGAAASGTAAFAAVYIGYSVAGLLGGIVVIVLFYAMSRTSLTGLRTIWRDAAPFIFLFVCLISVNLLPPLKILFTTRLALSLEIIPGHVIKIRPLFDAYLYLFLSLLLALKLQRVGKERLRPVLRKSLAKSLIAVSAMLLFGAMGQIIAYSGYSAGFASFDSGRNIPAILSSGLVSLAGPIYPVFAPILGWAGTFLTGYGVASILLFGKLQMETAALLGFSQPVLTSSLTVGASIGSISSPFKIAIAAPLCGAQGREGDILRKTIPLGIVISLLVGLFSFLLN